MDSKKLRGFASIQPPREIGGDLQNFALCKSRVSLDIETITFLLKWTLPLLFRLRQAPARQAKRTRLRTAPARQVTIHTRTPLNMNITNLGGGESMFFPPTTK